MQPFTNFEHITDYFNLHDFENDTLFLSFLPLKIKVKKRVFFIQTDEILNIEMLHYIRKYYAVSDILFCDNNYVHFILDKSKNGHAVAIELIRTQSRVSFEFLS